MKALLTWDVDPRDPEFQRIIFDLGALLPPGSTYRLTAWSAMIDPMTVSDFKQLATKIEELAAFYDQRLWAVIAHLPNNATVRGAWQVGVGGPYA